MNVTDQYNHPINWCEVSSNIECEEENITQNLAQSHGTEKLTQLLKESSTGEVILNEYKQKQILSDQSRRLLVSIIAKELQRIKITENRRLTKEDKCMFAEGVILLFPNLKNPSSPLGYEHFYDPKERKGYIESAIANSNRNKKKCASTSTTISTEASSEMNKTLDEMNKEEIVRESAIFFLKYAGLSTDKEAIIRTTKETFKYRREHCIGKDFFTIFPRFGDMPELILEEFDMLYTGKDRNCFQSSYSSYIRAILELYKIEKKQLPLEWDNITNSVIALTQLLPPVARGKKAASRNTAEGSVDNLIIFVTNGTPLPSISREKVEQLKIVAVGSDKKSIDQYFLTVYDRYLLLPTKDILEVVDYLFKSHFVFGISFDFSLSNFWLYIQKHFYDIDCKCSPKIIDIHTKLCTLKNST